LQALIAPSGLAYVRAAIALPECERQVAQQALELVHRLAPQEFGKSQRWLGIQLPRATCLRDIWHDHVLYTGNRVTGIIDFGAADVTSPAADIARLLGSMVGDDRQRWSAGLAAYESVRPLTDDERKAVRFFDSSGVVLSAANWLEWLYGREASRLAGTFDREAALSRFNILVGRLRTLAAASR
jgi:homoserine kinase type II